MKRTVAVITAVVMMSAATVRADQVQTLCRLKGSESSKIVGMGLVIGLNGTGDGDRFLPAMRPLAAITNRLLDQNTIPIELKGAKNVSVVMLSAEVKAGSREGDKLDVQLSAIAAKSLEGGRLAIIPMTGPLPNAPVFAFAEGAVSIEDPKAPNVAVVKGGATLVRNMPFGNLDELGRITLVLYEQNASWTVANNIAKIINGHLAPEGTPIARAVNEKNVVVEVPAAERENPGPFIAQVLSFYVDPAQLDTGPKVVINEKLGSIVISGDVQISPCVITIKGLTITTITPAVPPTPSNPERQDNSFAGVDPEKRGGTRLADLLATLNQFKVDVKDRIAIIREMHKSRKLHAQLIEE